MIWLLDSVTIIYALNGQGRCRQRLNSAPTRGRVATSSGTVGRRQLPSGMKPPAGDWSHQCPEQVVLRLSPMTPLWLAGEDGRTRLVVVRRVVVVRWCSVGARRRSRRPFRV